MYEEYREMDQVRAKMRAAGMPVPDDDAADGCGSPGADGAVSRGE